MPRSNWKGHITFGLVSIPIILQNAEDTSQKVSFHQLDRRNKARIKYQRVNAENGKEVPWEDIIKGYEYSKDNILIVEEGELDKIAGDNARTISIESFISANDIHFIDIEKTYFLLPDKGGEKGYVILRQALKEAKKMGIAKVIISTKEYLAAVAEYENALVLHLLHYSNELYSISDFKIPADDLKKYKVTSQEITIAKQLIQSMTKKWKPEKYKDEYSEAVHKWAESKAKKLPPATMKQHGKQAKNAKAVNLIDLLKRSLKDNKSSRTSERTKKRSPVRAHTSHHKHVTRH